MGVPSYPVDKKMQAERLVPFLASLAGLETMHGAEDISHSALEEIKHSCSA